MKTWAVILLSGISGLIGFAGGMIFERKKVLKAEQKEKEEKNERPNGKFRVTNIRKAKPSNRRVYRKTVQDLGYSANEEIEEHSDFDMDQAAEDMEKSLAEMEGPEEKPFPHTIDEDEWSANPYDYLQENLCFYAQDEMIADLEGNLADDPDGMLGEDNVRHMSENAEWLVLYIINDEIETMFRIDRVEASYAEVYG